MFGSRILEVAIGIIFIFLLVGMICSTIREGIESWRKSRGTGATRAQPRDGGAPAPVQGRLSEKRECARRRHS